MRKFIMCILVSLFFLPVQAVGIPKAEQHHEKQCTQRRANQCIAKCQKIPTITNCQAMCYENAKNECLYAGE